MVHAIFLVTVEPDGLRGHLWPADGGESTAFSGRLELLSVLADLESADGADDKELI
jgi:hypothetical protein